jgi:hypothetical protein
MKAKLVLYSENDIDEGMRRMSDKTCNDCGAKEGELHHLGCDMERCPFCGHQLLSCHCMYEKLNLIDSSKYSYDTGFLPPEIYYNGVTNELYERWADILNTKGRVPYISYPLMCAKCGELWPKFFRVPDKEWEYYIQLNQRRSIICEKCYDEIKILIDKKFRT